MESHDEQISIGIIHASGLIAEGLGDLLARRSGVAVVGLFGSAAEAQDAACGASCILLYDLETSQRDGPAQMAGLRARLPQARILVFGVADDDEAIIECVRAGAAGCILQDASPEDLLEAIRSLAAGTPPVSSRVVTTLFNYVAGLEAGADGPSPAALTRREEQILRLMADGMSNPEIARSLDLRPQTVKNYVHQVLRKLNLRHRLEAIRFARPQER